MNVAYAFMHAISHHYSPLSNLQLTFGDAPFRIESFNVSDLGDEGMEMELGLRWCGDANITLAVVLASGG